ncbi:alpha/beta hydrolase [Intrasporangium sp. YIM S08009]|uniref:alpha/beta fold hydrolase n=1 Tax=Intrasporangium zincisolvens TaxID=3080018 RepID=UPI002B05F045|nr:alpha/beta hydrolase [Intrasporangium sp. YIM S08009]
MSARPAIDGVRTVEVPGGALAYEVLDASPDSDASGVGHAVLAVHGVSSQRRLWLWLADALADVAAGVRLVAPDLRGRGDSVAVPGPFSMAVHADDLVHVLDDAGLDRVHVVGMSMGGFVAVHLAARHPERVESLVLVDGGVPMDPPPGLTRETVATAFADRVGRLERRFSGVEEYLDYFCSTTAPLLDRDDPVLRRYLSHDLAADGTVRLSGRALVEDAADVFFGEHPWDAVRAPVRFLHAEWSVGAGSPPAYPLPVVEQRAARCVRVLAARQTDHAGTIMGPEGARFVADLVREAVA